METTLIVTTWGSEEWRESGTLAAIHAPGANHIHIHDPKSAGDARNRAVRYFDPKGHICFLDADDSLAPGYFQAMESAHEHNGQLLTPALALGDEPARILDDRDIINGLNPCPIGTLIHRDLFDEVGGFGDWRAYEDFAMFQRAVLVGAKIRFVPEAVYVASINPRGRNSTVKNAKGLIREIRADNQAWLASR